MGITTPAGFKWTATLRHREQRRCGRRGGFVGSVLPNGTEIYVFADTGELQL